MQLVSELPLVLHHVTHLNCFRRRSLLKLPAADPHVPLRCAANLAIIWLWVICGLVHLQNGQIIAAPECM
jgi:hypothetical protein